MAIQRWNKSTSAVAVATGGVEYTFPAIGEGFSGIVSVSVPGSDLINTWTIFISGNLVGAVGGAQSYGPLFVGPGDVVTITGTPLLPTGVAVAVGAIGLVGEIAPSTIAPSVNPLATITAAGQLACSCTSCPSWACGRTREEHPASSL